MGSTTEEAAQRPARIGRFEVLGVLGEGGMGVVYEALDPTLGRHVAIKLLHDEHGGPDAAARLLREAQALARLAHPNVVMIFEAGRDGDQVFLAMELVHGSNARGWRDAGPRTIAQIIGVYAQAAAGLAAAHTAGLVHRDVKPENILVGKDGRVRITDFGLVAATGNVPDAAELAALDSADAMATPLTRTGMLLGTPPYMAPELHDRATADALADQWSLCVSIWEALAGVRPFAGATYRELVGNVAAGRAERGADLIAPPVREVLLRGLAVDRTQRWTSVAQLASALEKASTECDEAAPRATADADLPTAELPARRRLRWPVAAGVGVVVLGGGIALALRGDGVLAGPPPEPTRITTRGCPYMPVWADADTLVYDDGAGAIWRHDLGGEPEVLVDLPGEDWRAIRGRTPNEIVFATKRIGDSGAAAVDLVTKAITRLPIYSPSISVANGALFYTRMDVPEIRRQRDGEDAIVTRMPDGYLPYTVAVSPDGTRIAVNTNGDRGAVDMCFGRLDPHTDRVIDELMCLQRTDVERGRATYSPDGRTVYYPSEAGIRRRREVGDTVEDTLWRPNLDAMGGMDVSPDGTMMTYSASRPRSALLLVDSNTLIPGLDAMYSLFPLGQGRYLFMRENEDGSEIVLRRADGTLHVLTPPGLGTLRWIEVDVAGERFAFESKGKEPGIYVGDLRARPPLRVSTQISDVHPVWTRDGKLAFTRVAQGKQASVMLVDPQFGSAGDATLVPAHPAVRSTFGRMPDGRLILGVADDMYLWDPVTGAEQRIPLPPGEEVTQAVGSPDGRWVIMIGARELWRLPVPQDPNDTRGPEMIRAQRACETFGRPHYDDGKLVVNYGIWRGDVYTVPITP